MRKEVPSGTEGLAKLVEELAQYGILDLEKVRWPARLPLVRDLMEQLCEDIGDDEAGRQAAQAIITRIIVDLDDDPVRSREQAVFYGMSSDASHHAASQSWLQADPARGSASLDQRAAFRRDVNRVTKLWVNHVKLPCKLLNISKTGALLETTNRLDMGILVRLRTSWVRMRDAVVVRSVDVRHGVAFV